MPASLGNGLLSDVSAPRPNWCSVGAGHKPEHRQRPVPSNHQAAAAILSAALVESASLLRAARQEVQRPAAEEARRRLHMYLADSAKHRPCHPDAGGLTA